MVGGGAGGGADGEPVTLARFRRSPLALAPLLSLMSSSAPPRWMGPHYAGFEPESTGGGRGYGRVRLHRSFERRLPTDYCSKRSEQRVGIVDEVAGVAVGVAVADTVTADSSTGPSTSGLVVQLKLIVAVGRRHQFQSRVGSADSWWPARGVADVGARTRRRSFACSTVALIATSRSFRNAGNSSVAAVAEN